VDVSDSDRNVPKGPHPLPLGAQAGRAIGFFAAQPPFGVPLGPVPDPTANIVLAWVRRN
jgi:hypothetical protein